MLCRSRLVTKLPSRFSTSMPLRPTGLPTLASVPTIHNWRFTASKDRISDPCACDRAFAVWVKVHSWAKVKGPAAWAEEKIQQAAMPAAMRVNFTEYS